MSRYEAPCGYTYNTENFCLGCILQAMSGVPEKIGYVWSLEAVLDQIAGFVKINRYDENTFDSSEFPKVILSVEEPEYCSICGQKEIR